MADTTDLATWLRAQLDDDEAQQQGLNAWHTPGCSYLPDGDQVTYPCDCGIPDRALRAVTARRRILDLYVEHELMDRETFEAEGQHARSLGSLRAAYFDAIRLLATEYADRPGYRDEWRP